MRTILLNNGTRELFDRCNIRLEPYFDRLHWRGRVNIEEYASFKTDFLHTSGAFSYSFSTLPGDTVVGRYCSIAHEVRGFADSHPTHYISTHPFLTDGGEWHDKARRNGSDWAERLHHVRDYGPIEIGHDVWIGRGAQIKGGVKIGTGTVIAAGAFVTKDVEPYTIVGGVPAKIIRGRFDNHTVELMLETEWWNYAYWDLKALPFDDPARFARQFLDEIKPTLKPFAPRIWSVPEILSA